MPYDNLAMLVLLRSRLSVRLAALFLLASLTPILGAAVLLPRVFEESARADAARRHRVLAQRCVALVEEHVERAHAKLRTVARLLSSELGSPEARAAAADAPENSGVEAEAVAERLQGLVDPPDAFLELQYFAGGADPRFVGQARQPLYEVTQRLQHDYLQRNLAQIHENFAADLVQRPLRERAEWRSPSLEAIEGYTTLTLSVPVEEPGGTAGALAAYVDFAPLIERLRALAGGEYAFRVADARGRTLAAVGAAVEPALGVSLPAGETGWSVEVSEPAAGLEATLGRFRRQLLPWIAVAGTIAIALSFALSSWITRPISALRRAAERLERGDLGASVNLSRADEIGGLALAFDRMAAALRELDHAKSEFVANVSHELRTPLTSMRLSVENLLDGVVGELDPRQRAALERVERELERLVQLVNQLLDLTRLEAGAVRPALERVELAPLAREVVESLAALASERGIAVGIEGAGAVRGDRRMLQRVLLNLLDNAIKFSPRGGAVRVHLGPRGLRVEDQGSGLDPAQAFEAFRQGSQQGVKHPGAGLGLAIVKKLVEVQGGTVRAERPERPECNRGAVLVVELPEGG